jgi:hypothetical protein
LTKDRRDRRDRPAAAIARSIRLNERTFGVRQGDQSPIRTGPDFAETTSMGSKRTVAKPSQGPSSGSSPLVTAVLLLAAVGLGVATLVARGRLAWPPTRLLASLFTLAGCLALVGPVLLMMRRGSGPGGLGELLWMAGGLIVWVYDLAAIVRGDWRSLAPATPLGYQPMGLTILAVLLAGWRWRPSSHDWSWTNVTGWLLGLFWVGMGVLTMAPGGALMASAR